MKQKTTDGILLLSHCGFSFLEDLIDVLATRGLRSYVLSSQPLAEHQPQRLTDLRSKVTILFSTQAHELTQNDVDIAICTLKDTGEKVLACITVWEGYRQLMAQANAMLGVPDLAPEKISGLRDKLALRNRLYDAGLSMVRAQILTSKVLTNLQHTGKRYFIKPVFGIASYGAFPLREDTTWDVIQSIRDEAKGDIVYRSILNEGVAFMAEDYIHGCEFSFELIVVDSNVHVIGIHEKCELTEATGTVLENSCTSPPYSINNQTTLAGIEWIRAIFSHLALDWGCFHVEARFDGKKWDLIEINPRVGGSLISHSIKALNSEHSMLELWVELLLAYAPKKIKANSQAYLSKLSRLSYTDDGTQNTQRATFFRVYFATPGKVKHVSMRKMKLAPIVSHILLRSGEEITNTAREVFLGQLLWQLTRAERDATLPDLIRSSNDAIDIQYAQEEFDLERTLA